MNVEIRELKAGDEAVLERVAIDVFDRAIDPDYLSAYLAEPNQHMIIALRDGEVVGQIRALRYKHPDKADEFFIENLGVTPALQRQGIATQLLRAMLKLSQDLDCQEVWVATEDNNKTARRFYESFGGEADATVMYTFKLDEKL